jgi:hypothetical protein
MNEMSIAEFSPQCESQNSTQIFILRGSDTTSKLITDVMV